MYSQPQLDLNQISPAIICQKLNDQISNFGDRKNKTKPKKKIYSDISTGEWVQIHPLFNLSGRGNSTPNLKMHLKEKEEINNSEDSCLLLLVFFENGHRGRASIGDARHYS
jgi:hypothetical protein